MFYWQYYASLFHLPPFIKFSLQDNLNTPVIEKTPLLYLLISDGNSSKSEIDHATINFLKECRENDFLKQLESSNHGYQQQQDCCEFLEAYFNHINEEIYEWRIQMKNILLNLLLHLTKIKHNFIIYII